MRHPWKGLMFVETLKEAAIPNVSVDSLCSCHGDGSAVRLSSPWQLTKLHPADQGQRDDVASGFGELLDFLPVFVY